MAKEERAYLAYIEWIKQAHRVVTIFEKEEIELPEPLKNLIKEPNQ